VNDVSIHRLIFHALLDCEKHFFFIFLAARSTGFLSSFNSMAEFTILRTWEVESSINNRLHQAASAYYSKIDKMFMVPIVLISTAMGTLGIISASRSTQELDIINIIIASFGFLTAALTTIHNSMNFKGLQSTHAFHAIEYSKICREIKMHIYLCQTQVKVYANIAEYIKSCRTRIDKLIESSDEIPFHIEKKLTRQIDLIRREQLVEVNELIQLSKQNNKDLQQRQLNVRDLYELSEIYVMDARKCKSNSSDNSSDTEISIDSHNSRSGIDLHESEIKVANDQLCDTTNTQRASNDSSSASKDSDDTDTSVELQRRLSLDVFYKNMNALVGEDCDDAKDLLSRKIKRQNWKSDYNL
jgi:hypothetical protein